MILHINSLEEYQRAYALSLQNPEVFWGEIAKAFVWEKPFERVFSGGYENVDYRWFEGGVLNLCVNCLDRHLPEKASHPALIFEPNNPNEPIQRFSYKELLEAVCQTANALKQLGVKPGDRVCVYMPMIPEAAITMLAIARIGAIHSVVFGGFSANALADRLTDCTCEYIVTADSAFRGAKEVPLKAVVDEALTRCPFVKSVLVVKRTGTLINFKAGRDVWWHDLVTNQAVICPPVFRASEDPLFILYTSGSTGKPKGVLHTTGGYMVYVGYTFRNVFQIQPNDLHFCTADVGWITGHSYGVYGPLLNGITTLIYEGVPTWPTEGRLWEIIDKHQATILYTAPTAIRALEALGLNQFQGKKLTSLRVLGTVGEPINLEAWEWYDKHVGDHRCPIVDTWWQTETGGIMISSLAGVTPQKPTFATLPLPGIEPLLVDGQGNPITSVVAEGNLCIKRSWPAQARTMWGDHQRFKESYFATYPGLYFTGDGAKRDAEGHYRITGRVDDVINVSGHRIGTAEVENAIDKHPLVIETAVVGYPHDVKGQGIYAFVISEPQTFDPTKTIEEIRQLVAREIGAFAKPDKIQFVRNLPKTRSGKIMRRILRKIAEGDTSNFGDVSTLLDPSVVEELKANAL